MRALIVFAAFFMAVSGFEDHSLWTQFKTQHSRDYQLDEDQFRFEIFQNNLRIIEKHNNRYEKEEVSYYLKITKFTDWTEEEFRSLLNSQAATIPNNDDNVKKFSPDSNFIAPDSIDWREKNAVLRVKDQGGCGACWAFSTTGALEGQLAIHKNQQTSLSEQQLINCSDDYGNTGCKGGRQVKAFNYVKDHGIVSDYDYPYWAFQSPCFKENITKVISGISEIKQLETTEDALVAAIASIGPITVCADGKTWQLYGGGVYDNENCGDELNHAILAVGYTKDYIIIKNSWSEYWGENGYIRLARGKNMCGVNNRNSVALL